ncbi:tRNA (adenosine(37)-N6)-threonylcarbamoyltransferase complex transferase subunit TsaD [Patescibacteria group bacterium]|nr:tRNA (adenosine(37)-N6)-threonylcarbamoyltransferase complex transferase subunit TsaD [Patescibacteria group bacterium]
MIILAIETSCDETAIALVKFQNSRSKILSNIIFSQVEIHKKWGGVVPNLAKREHQRNLVPVLKKALLEARLLKSKIKNQQPKIQTKNKKLKEILEREKTLYQKLKFFLADYQKPKIELVAVTVGLGLEPALWVGVNFAKALSYFWRFPIIPVNHIEAHIFAHFINKKFQIQDKTIFPALSLSVSGGHTQLTLIKDYGKYKLLGETRDDTAGECFDKVARMLGLGYPGGPIIEKLATKGNPRFFHFPRPMMYTKDYDFSFSGLKTAVLYFLKKQNRNRIKKHKNDICASFQQAVIDVLIGKTIKAAKQFKVKTVTLGGGVMANKELRKQLKESIRKEMPNTKYQVPDVGLCIDNAAMVAMAAYFRSLKKESKNWKEITTNANLKL